MSPEATTFYPPLQQAKKLIQMASGRKFVKRKLARPQLALSLLLMAALLGAAVPKLPAQNNRFDTGAYARVLEQFVTGDGRVRYAALKQDPASLNEFLNLLAAVSPENRPELFPTPEAQIAYWVNAYNAFVLKGVLNGYPVGSVRAFKFGFGLTFFKRAKHWAGGKKYSLDDIEHGILRKRYAEPRIHFAVNCASTSCPVLRNEPFQPETLDQQLDDAARRFIRQQENVWMRGDVLFLSKIFDWYEKDFIQQLQREGATNPKLADYVARYLPEDEARRVREQSPRVEFYRYDWSLNDASPRKK